RAALIYEHDAVRQLEDFGRIGRVHHARNARGQAESFGIVLRLRSLRGLEKLLALLGEGHLHRLAVYGLSLLLHVNDVGHLPDASHARIDALGIPAKIGFTGIDAKIGIVRQMRSRAGRWTRSPAASACATATTRSSRLLRRSHGYGKQRRNCQ